MEPKEVLFERTFEAPAATVWEAWTDPQQLKQWWGPDNVTIPECRIDLRIGGEIYIVMEATEAMGEYKGTRWPLQAEITEMVPGAKLTYAAKAWTEGQEDETTIEQVQELSLADEGGKTRMTLKATLTKVGSGAGMAVEGMQYGYNQQFDKLVAYLAK